MRIAWGGIATEFFSAVNGVKQGAVLSPVLFCIYLDDLLIRLSKAGIGCFLGPVFVGALAYADDIVLVAPTASAMRSMLDICDHYAHDYHILFNARKTKSLVMMPNKRRGYSPCFEQCVFYIDNTPIERVESFSHLGHSLTSSLSDDKDISKRCGEFASQANNVLCYFRNLNSSVRFRLFRSYCTSFYGCELWHLDNHNIENLCVAWRKGMRRVFDIPSRTHNKLLPLLGKCLPLFDEICLRSLKFAHKCMFHSSSLIRTVASFGILDARGFSFFGRNISLCMHRYGMSVFDFFNNNFSKLIDKYVHTSCAFSDVVLADLLSDTIKVRDGELTLANGEYSLNTDDINYIIDFICTGDSV